MKFRIILYAIIAIGLQVALGYLTDMGQGGIGMLTFIVMIEIDPKYSFSYLLQNKQSTDK